MVKEVRCEHRSWRRHRKPLCLTDMHTRGGTPTVLHVSMEERTGHLFVPQPPFRICQPVPEMVLDMTSKGVAEVQILTLPVHTLVLQGRFLPQQARMAAFPHTTRVLKLWHCGAHALEREVVLGICVLKGDQHAWPRALLPGCAWLLGLARSLQARGKTG